jgi:hypothetical protein
VGITASADCSAASSGAGSECAGADGVARSCQSSINGYNDEKHGEKKDNEKQPERSTM